MGSPEHNHGNISSLIGAEMLNFGKEAFCTLFFLNITTKLVISQIKFLWRHHLGTLYCERNCNRLVFCLEGNAKANETRDKCIIKLLCEPIRKQPLEKGKKKQPVRKQLLPSSYFKNFKYGGKRKPIYHSIKVCECKFFCWVIKCTREDFLKHQQLNVNRK